MKNLRTDCIWEVLAVMRCRNTCPPVSYPQLQRLKYREPKIWQLYFMDVKLASHSKGETVAESVREWGAEEDIWSEEGRCTRRVQ
jgi:hypothetical protein